MSWLASTFPELQPLYVIKYGGEFENASAIKSEPLALLAAMAALRIFTCLSSASQS